MAEPVRVIDITLPFSEHLPVWPGDAPVQITRATDSVTISELRMSSHAGTHLDAPAHFFAGSRTVDQLALEALIGPAWVCDCSGTRPVTAYALRGCGIPAGASRVLIKTTNSNRAWLKQSAGRATPVAFDTQFAGIDEGAGRWLLDHGVLLAGVDGPSVDPYDSDFPVHRLLLGHDVIIVENLDLSDVQPGPYRLICLPLPYEGGDGAPVRAVLETTE